MGEFMSRFESTGHSDDCRIHLRTVPHKDEDLSLLLVNSLVPLVLYVRVTHSSVTRESSLPSGQTEVGGRTICLCLLGYTEREEDTHGLHRAHGPLLLLLLGSLLLLPLLSTIVHV